ncbi:MAG: DNA repair protein RecN [Syntrophomonadaceae bacterium]|nr:DNA repair protein RecN [Syntrophomonadaceae bacterium]
MLLEIYIKNFVLIEEQRLEFGPGLNVLTGETGAGKSIIMDALGLVLGERSKNDYVRDESKKAIVEAVFALQPDNGAFLYLLEQGLSEDDNREVVLSREIYVNGRNTARVNGRNVPLSTLRYLGSLLVDMQSQNDRHDFLQADRYLDYVDSFTENSAELIKHVAQRYGEIRFLREQMTKLEMSRQQREQRIDFLQYQIKEIEAADLREGEEEELKALRERIRNAGQYMQASGQVLNYLYGSEHDTSAYDFIASAASIAAGFRQDSLFAQILAELENISCSLQDMSRELSAFKDTLDFEPDQLEKLEDRLYLISKLERKYGAAIKDVLAFQQRCIDELATLTHSEEQQDKLNEDLHRQQDEYYKLAGELSQYRQQAARKLEEKVALELSELNMPDIRFQIRITALAQPSEKGMDEAEFLFSPNPGEELRPAARIASGGEISRLILALKTSLAEKYKFPTLIFDEIDAGLGGTALNAMAQKIARLATQHQLILVTHSPQLASYADQHLFIDKYVENGRTFTSVFKLDPQARITELARMLDGDNYTELTLQHARELMENRNSILL